MAYQISKRTANGRIAYLLQLEVQLQFKMLDSVNIEEFRDWNVSRVKGWTAKEVMSYNDLMRRTIDRVKAASDGK